MMHNVPFLHMSEPSLLYPLLAGMMVMLMSLIGVIALNSFFQRWVHAHLSHLVSFAAGVFAVVVVNIFREAAATLALPALAALASLGIGIMYALGKVITDYHHHHREDACENIPDHARPHALRILAADAVHNASDGIVIATAFIASVPLGIAVTLAVMVHEAIQELSEFFVLRRAGLSTKEALVQNFLVSSTVLIGITAGLFLSEAKALQGGVLTVAGGALLLVVAQDLIPHSLLVARKEGVGRHMLWAALGAGAMAAIATTVAA